MDMTLHNSVLTPHNTTSKVRPFMEIGMAPASETYTSHLDFKKSNCRNEKIQKTLRRKY